MNKLKYLLLILPFLFIGSVKADDLQLSLNNYYATYKNEIGVEKINDIINEVLEEYKSNYMSDYPYYFISIGGYELNGFYTESYFSVILYYFSDFPDPYWFVTHSGDKAIDFLLSFRNVVSSIGKQYPIYINNDYVFGSSFSLLEPSSILNFLIYMYPSRSYDRFMYYPSTYYASNFDLYLPSINSALKNYSSGYLYDYDNILIPNLDDPTLFTVVSYDKTNYLVQPYYLYDNDIDIELNNNLVEVNLNDYAYIALALKDYKQDPFSSQVYAKGNYCITPVYNYGMTERNEILSGTKVERCSPYYETYTPIRTYITDSDLNNNAIYYLKAYDTSKDNYVKIDTSIFDITYITEENKDNPYVTIDGKSYPTLSYDSLSDTATKSEDEGYVSGAVEEFSFTDIFTAPLEYLKDIWSAIISFFAMITEFLALLPPTLQGFLYTSFTLAIILGLIKILL